MLYSVNQTALSITLNPVQYQRSKYIAIRYQFIRQAIQNDQITLAYVPTDEQITDILTKTLKSFKHAQPVKLLRFV
jgi:hypothetical protein